MRLDTLTPNQFPQFGNDPRQYLTHVLAAMSPHRVADGLKLQLRCVPPHGNIDIAAAATFEGRAAVPTGSYLYALSGSSSQAAGFDLQIRDTGTQAELFGRKCFYKNCTGQGQASDTPASPLHYLAKPLLLLEPGELLVQIWNRAAAVNTIQVVLWFATPETEE